MLGRFPPLSKEGRNRLGEALGYLLRDVGGRLAAVVRDGPARQRGEFLGDVVQGVGLAAGQGVLLVLVPLAGELSSRGGGQLGALNKRYFALARRELYFRLWYLAAK